MGTVLSFEPRKRSAKRQPLPPASAPSIVIFPGVRYERYTTGEARLPNLLIAEAPRPSAPPRL